MRAFQMSIWMLAAVMLAAGCETTSPSAEIPVNGSDQMQVLAGPRLVEMSGFNFVPSRITVVAGDTVEWRNTSRIEHTVTCDPSYAQNPANVKLPQGALPFNSGILTPGESFVHTFTVPGTYRYVCIPHERSGMLGEVEVVEPFVTAPLEETSVSPRSTPRIDYMPASPTPMPPFDAR